MHDSSTKSENQCTPTAPTVNITTGILRLRPPTDVLYLYATTTYYETKLTNGANLLPTLPSYAIYAPPEAVEHKRTAVFLCQDISHQCSYMLLPPKHISRLPDPRETGSCPNHPSRRKEEYGVGHMGRPFVMIPNDRLALS
jgi:hypothetical protein